MSDLLGWIICCMRRNHLAIALARWIHFRCGWIGKLCWTIQLSRFFLLHSRFKSSDNAVRKCLIILAVFYGSCATRWISVLDNPCHQILLPQYHWFESGHGMEFLISARQLLLHTEMLTLRRCYLLLVKHHEFALLPAICMPSTTVPSLRRVVLNVPLDAMNSFGGALTACVSGTGGISYRFLLTNQQYIRSQHWSISKFIRSTWLVYVLEVFRHPWIRFAIASKMLFTDHCSTKVNLYLERTN